MLTTFLPERARRGLVGAFFGGLLLLGLWLVRDYGVSYDEDYQRTTGQVSLLYVFQQLPVAVQQRLVPAPLAARIARNGGYWQLHQYRDRDYGVAFELPLAAAEQLLRLRDERAVYLFRHACTFLLGWAGLLAFYRLAARRFGSWRVGLLGTLLLVLSPRLFADFFYNDKDAAFLALFTLALATAVPFVRRPTWRTAAWHALACALAINVRIMGVLLPAATLGLLLLRAGRRDYGGRTVGAAAAVYVGLLVALVVGLWPYLWEAPLTNFIAAFRNMSHFRWLGSVLYQGQEVRATRLPWHYAPVWIGLTTPLPYLLLAGVGSGLIVRQIVRRGWRLFASDDEWQDLLFLGLSTAPLVAVIGLRSELYNGWRQLYFLYPPLLLVALRGLVALAHWQPPARAARRYWRPAAGLLLGAALASTASQMVRLHPLENLYFNALAPAHPEQFYEGDYWGLSYRQGLEWLLRHDARRRLRVYSPEQHPLVLNRLLLPAASRARVEVVDSPALANYVVSWPADWPGPPLHSVWAAHVRALNVFRLR